MITLITGDNSFEIERDLSRITADFRGEVERIDGSDLELRHLPDLLMGGTLFATKRLVIIKNLSENKSLWVNFADWIPRISDDITIILVDTKPDKRTLTYKELKKQATLRELQQWTDRDSTVAEKWLISEAKDIGLMLDSTQARLIVRRVGFDQWQLYHGLEKLSLAGDITADVIEDIIDSSPTENVFNLFDLALRGQRQKIADMLRTLELTEDPYRLFALLSGQAFQLAAVAVAGRDENIAKDFGVHPYAISKIASMADQFGRAGARKIISEFAKADDDMKTSRAEPWLLIERTLMSVATQQK